MIAACVAAGVRLGLGGITFEPAAHVIVIALLAPQQAGESLALHVARVFAELRIDAFSVEFVGLLLALVEDFLNTQTAGQWSGQGAPAIRQGTA